MGAVEWGRVPAGCGMGKKEWTVAGVTLLEA